MSFVEERLTKLGLTIPNPTQPIGSFLTYMRCENLLFISGHTSILKDGPAYRGKVGSDVSIEEAVEGARIAALRCIGAIKAAADLDRIKIIKVTGYVNATPDFKEHPSVINGASDLFEQTFGMNGKHTRCAVGVASLPGNACVEVELIAQVLGC